MKLTEKPVKTVFISIFLAILTWLGFISFVFAINQPPLLQIAFSMLPIIFSATAIIFALRSIFENRPTGIKWITIAGACSLIFAFIPPGLYVLFLLVMTCSKNWGFGFLAIIALVVIYLRLTKKKGGEILPEDLLKNQIRFVFIYYVAYIIFMAYLVYTLFFPGAKC